MQFLWERFLQQRERWILWNPVAMAAGVGGYFSLSAEPPLWVGLGGIAVLAAVIAPFYKNKAVVLVWLPFFLIALGFAAAQARTWMVEAPMLERRTYPTVLEARVTEVQALPQGYHRIVLDQLSYEARGAAKPEKVRIKLKKNSLVPRAGDVVRVKAILSPVPSPALPGSYDFQRHSFFLGIGATGFAISDVEILAAAKRGYFFENLRRSIRTIVKGGMKNGDAAAITVALLDGEDSDLSKETYETIRAAGIAHLIAISGLQVTLVTGFFFFVVRAFLASIPYVALRWPIKKITAFIAMCGAIFYMMLIGSSISAERSVIMVCVVMLAIMLDRDPFTLRLAAFAAAAILLFQPENLFGPGFQLSFAAVTALIAFYESTREWWAKDYAERGLPEKAGMYVLGSLATTLVATAATAPFVMYHFLKTPLFPGLIANLVAVPLSSFVTIPAAIIGCLLAPVGLGGIPLAVAEWSVMTIIRTAEIIAEWPHAVYRVDAWPMSILVMISVGGLWVCIWRGGLRWLGLMPVLAGALLIPLAPRADILIADGAKLFAVRDEAGVLHMTSGKADKFVRQVWQEREGEEGSDIWPDAYADSGHSPLSCDREACLYRHKGYLVSFVKEYGALQKDCREADVVISDLYIKPYLCRGPKLVIDRWSIKQSGAQAIYLSNDRTLTVRTVRDEQGKRPWTKYSRK